MYSSRVNHEYGASVQQPLGKDTIHSSEEVGAQLGFLPQFPIAVIGIGCRFPGDADSPDKFWELLQSGRDALSEVPPSRWDPRRFFDSDATRPGKTQVLRAGFLRQSLEHFDPLPFGMSPREAEGLDPQQRLLLETTWEAFEDAGQNLDRLRGSSTGVFVGGFCVDTQLIRLNPLNRELIDLHTAASATMTMLASRLSYVFDLRGPSLTLDTACSSSLVAVHYACQSLWSGNCAMALAGGANTMLVPDYFIAMSKGHFLSPRGRCAAFDTEADGYARGEGAGIVVLKPLDRALADGDPVRAVIHASGVNQDGRTAGITLPSGDAQAALISDVYKRAGVGAHRVAYVEAHGTGTQAGDKAEIETLAQVLAPGRGAERPCLVGAVKTNIGHLEAAAGVAGLIKTVLVLQHRRVPANLHYHAPNPAIAWPQSGLQLATGARVLMSVAADVDAQPYAAVNAFGYGGTNAHVLLQAAPAGDSRFVAPAADLTESAVDGGWLLPLSACDETALRQQAATFAALLASNRESVADIAHSAACRRTHLRVRIVANADDQAGLVTALTRFAAAEDAGDALISGEAQSQASGPVFVFSGMGPQWWGMGRVLARRESVFREAIEEVDALFSAVSGWSIIGALGTCAGDSRVEQTQVAQPANLMLQVALTRLLQRWGVEPAAVVGHSIGEVAAAWCCGALDLGDAVTVAWRRSQCQQTLASVGGGMLAVGMTPEGASNLLRNYPDVGIAAFNGPRALTLAGPLAALREIGTELDRHEVFHRLLKVEIAYHSSAMELIREPLLDGFAGVVPRQTRLPWFSTAMGNTLNATADAQYWWKNVRNPVLFHPTIDRMIDGGHRDFLEIGPHPVLSTALREIHIRKGGGWVGATLHCEQDENTRMRAAVASLHVRGHHIDWPTFAPTGRAVSLPTYPWQRQHYWRESRRSREDRLGRPGAVWLNATLSAPNPTWQVEVNRQFFPWLVEHRVDGHVVFPGAAYVAAGLALGQKIRDTATPSRLAAIEFHALLKIDAQQLQMLVSTVDPATNLFQIYSHCGEADDGAWLLHATGRLHSGTMSPVATVGLASLRANCPVEYNVNDYYVRLARAGLDYGATFRRLRSLHIGVTAGEAFMELAGPDAFDADCLPAPVLDAALQGIFAPMLEAGGPIRTWVPVAIDSLCIYSALTSVLFAHVRLRERGSDDVTADLGIFDSEGKVLVQALGVRCKALPQPTRSPAEEWYYQPAWPQRLPPRLVDRVGTAAWLVLGGSQVAACLAQRLTAAGAVVATAALTSLGDLERDRSRWREEIGRLPPLAPVKVVALFDEAEDSEPGYASVLDQVLTLSSLAQVAGELAESRAGFMLAVVTRDSQKAGAVDTVRNPTGAALWGLLRTAASEMPGLNCRLVDLGELLPADDAAFLHSHLAEEVEDDEVACRGIAVHQLQWQRADTAITKPAQVAVSRSRHATLCLHSNAFTMLGQSPIWREVADSPVMPGSILVEIDRWVLTGTRSGRNTPSSPAGLEWHGRVIHAGDSESRLPGQTVWGLGPLPVATRMRVGIEKLEPPMNGLPVPALPLLYAWHCLVTLGGAQAGQAVLLHNVRDPLNSAFVSLAHEIGLRVSHEESANLLIALAGNDVSAFVDIERIATAGRVVAEAHSLAPSVGVAKLLANRIELLPCDLTGFICNSEATTAARAGIQSLIDRGWHPPERSEGLIVANAETVLATIQTAPLTCLELTGQTQFLAQPLGRSVWGLRRAATYIITGGTSGFGLEVAQWLAAQGIGQVILASRRGLVADSDRWRVARIEASGCRVTLATIDVTDAAAVNSLVSGSASGLLPLRGIIHCAMVLDDGWLHDLEREAFARVLAPKIAGAINLHQATQDIDLDCFVLFSSVSVLLGNPGQANYAAANSWLDGFAHWRRSQGLTAISINWGAIRDVGVVATRSGLLSHLEESGVGAIESAQALSALGRLLLSETAQAGVFDINWVRWRQARGGLPQRLVELAGSAEADAGALASVQADMALLNESDRSAALVAQLRRQLADVLRLRVEQVAAAQAPSALGLDSLMTLEWTLVIQQEWGLDVSASELLKAPSLDALAERLLKRVMQ